MDDDRTDHVGTIAAALPAEYEAADEHWQPVDATSARVIGKGGSSIVIPALYRTHLRRAIKIYLPRPDLREALDMRHFVETYDNELLHQASISHQNLSKITDFSSIMFNGEEFPFLATEFIDGLDLMTWSRSPHINGKSILKVLTDVLRGLGHLHNNGVMHCDLKQDNILVQSESEPVGVIVDLGSSRHFPDDLSTERELLYFFTTPKYVNATLQLVISNRTENRVSRANLRKQFPYQDLHSFGVILQDLMAESQISEKLQSAIGSSGMSAMQHIIERLQDGRPDPKYFQSADEVSHSIERVGKHSLAVLGIPELTLAPEKGVVIPGKEPRLHGTGRVDRVMSHPLYQRFHNLPQLDLLNWTLPGATHTRYVHAAHSYDLAREAVGYLLNNWEARLQVTSKDIETTLFSALINQMGHYHFLHMFEDFIEVRETDPLVQKAHLRNDEELLDDILSDSPSDLGTLLASIKDERGRTLPNIVDSLGIDWADARRRQRTPATPLEGVLAALLSGPLDVEKLAYLRDDSQAAGLQFGTGLNGTPVFESIVIPRQEDWEREKEGYDGIILGVRERAISYLEYGVLTRYWNIQTAYWNRTNRAVQSMLKYQIGCLIRAGLMDFESYIADTLHQGSDGALRWINNRFKYAQDDGLIDDLVVNPMADLLESRRVIYQRLITISGKSTLSSRNPDHQIYNRIKEQSPLDEERIYETIERALCEVVADLKVRPGEILVDLPRVSRDTTKGTVLVYTDDGSQVMGELFKIAPNLQQHQLSFDQYVKRMRVFIHPRIHSRLRSAGQTEQAHNRCLQSLRSAFVR